MPENDKIQLPKGFKLDQGAGQPEVKLPKGFTLETADVKKKVGGEESSLTELSSKGFSPEQISLLQTGTKPPKPVGKTGGTTIIPTNITPDQKAYERELKRQDAAINTLKNTYSKKGLNFNEKSKRGQEQIAELLDKEINNDLTLVTGKDQKPYLVRGEGFLESAGRGILRSIIDPIESTKINFTNDAVELADLLDEKIKEEPNVPESAPTRVGGYLGELAGGLPKMMALLAIPVAGESAMVGEMYHNALANQRRVLYERGLQEGMDRTTAAQNAMKNAPITAIPDAIVGAALARGVGGKAAGTEIIPNAAKESFLKATGNGLKGVAKVSGIGGAAEFGRSKAEQQLGYNVTDAEAIENGLRGMGEYAIMDAAFKLAHSGPKYLSSAAKNLLSSVPKEVLEVAAEKYPDGKQTLEDVAKFTETKAKVQDFVPEEKVAAVTGLTEKVQNLENNIKELEERKKTSSQALHPFMDGWIKEYQDEIDFYKKQVDKVVKSKDPTGVVEEIDDVTGLKAGQAPEVVEEKVEDITQFPETLKAKPTEVKEEQITFKTPQGAELQGEKIEIPGYEDIEMVLVKDGFENKIYELASGIELGDTKSAFSKEDAIKSLRDELLKRNVSSEKIKNALFKGEKVKQINPSKIFESYAEERKAREKGEYENLPLSYTPEEISKLNELKKQAQDLALENSINEIDKAIVRKSKAEAYKPPVDFFEKMIERDIERKEKAESESKKIPYPEKYIQKLQGTEEELAKSIQTGKKDKLSEMPQDVKNAVVDAWKKFADLKNKYGYLFSESMDDFTVALLRYTGTLKARENRTEKLAIEQKKLKNAIDNINKLHKEEFKTKENAVQEPSPESVLQPEQERVRETGGERKRVEPSVKGKEIAKEGKQAKIDEKRTPQVKPLSEFKVGDKFVFATDKGGSEHTIVSIDNGIVKFKTKGSKEVSSASEIQRLGNDLALLKSDWNKGIRPNESELKGSRFKTKIKPTKEQINNLTKELLKVDYAGAEPKENPESAKDFYEDVARRYLENDIDIVKVVDDLHGGKDRLQEIINGVTPKKTYQEALKEKQEAEKKQTRQAAGEKAAVSRRIFDRVFKMDVPEDAEQIALRYLADGGKVSKAAVDEAYGSVKRAALNTGRRELLSEEVKSKDFVGGKETLDEIAHKLWEESGQRVPESEIKDRLMAEIGNNNTRLEAAEAYLEKYDFEYQEEKRYERLAQEAEAEFLEEQAKLEEELRKPLDEQIEGEASEEHINNLIKQYEAEIKGEDQQLRPESKGEAVKEISSREAGEKVAKTEAELAKDYKEVISKASKKAKENAKKDFVDRNFDSIVAKLKIQIKCPT
jgi:hypothetical protein